MQARAASPPDLCGLCDGSLAVRAAGEPAAFAELYDRYLPRVYRYAYRRLGSHSDAEDLAAQTFQRALEAIGRYEERGLPFGAWLFRIAHNLIVDRRRVQRGDLPLDGMLHDPIDRDPPPDAMVVA
jgi:RNA polymerase sigma-70 factor, ECF subfamily